MVESVSIFTAPPLEEENTSIFTAREEDVKPPPSLPNYVKADIAERYSPRTGVPYQETMNTADSLGINAITAAPDAPTEAPPMPDIVATGFLKRMTAEELQAVVDSQNERAAEIANSNVNKDIVEGILGNLPEAQRITASERAAIFAGEIRAITNEMTPEKGMLSSAFDVMGSIANALTVGPIRGAFDMDKKWVQDYWTKGMNAPDAASRQAIAKEFITESKRRGLVFGNNTIEITHLSEALASGGVTLNQAAMAPVDILLTLGPGIYAKGTKALKSGIRVAPEYMLAAKDSVDTAAVLGGQAAADTATTFALENSTAGVQIGRQAAPAASRVGQPSILNAVFPTVRPSLYNEQKNFIIKDIKEVYMGDILDPKLLEKTAQDIVDGLGKHQNSAYLNHTIVDDVLGNKSVSIQIGREDGKFFKTKSSADKANAFYKGEVGTIALANGKKEYVIVVDQNIGLAGLGKITEEADLATGAIRNLIGSPETTSSIEKLTIGKLGQNKLSFILGGSVREYVRSYTAIGKEAATLKRIMTNLQESGRNSGYTMQEFKQKWYDIKGAVPSAAVERAYENTMYLRDAEWLISSDINLKKLNDSNVKLHNFKEHGEVKASLHTDNVTDGDPMVYNLTTKGSENRSVLQGKNQPVYRLAEEIEINGETVEYVTGDILQSRRLTHYDAMPYNPGGIRDTSATHFLIQKQRGVNLVGREVAKTPRLVYGTASEKAVGKAMNEVNAIIKKIRSYGVDKAVTAKGVKAAVKASEQEINSFILANNNFSPSIENLDDFLDMMDKAGMSLDEVTSVARDQSIGLIEGNTNRLLNSTSTAGDLYKYQHSLSKDRYVTRMAPRLNGSQIDPMRAIERDFSRAINHFAQRNYLKAAVDGLIRGGKKNSVILNEKDLFGLSLREQLDSMRVDTSTLIGRKYEQERITIIRSLNEKSGLAKGWERAMNSTQEYIFDKGFGQWSMFDKLSSDPFVALRGWAFDLKLGLFNLDQLIVQSSQIPSIIAISPKHGGLAFGDLAALRVALVDGRPSVVSALAKRAAKASMMSEKNFLELHMILNKSGRMHIGSNIVELSAEESISYGMVNKIREAGRMPFQEGEKMTRIMATDVAYREFKEKFPLVDIGTKQGYNMAEDFITKRADALTSHMTGSSAAVWQKGALSLSTQWLSFAARNFEQVFIGRTLTKWESRRLALSQLVYFGATGAGIGYTVDSILDSTDTTLDPDTYTLVKHGVFDWIIGEVSGARTAFSERFAVGAGIRDLIDNIQDKSFVEIAAGPAPKLVYDIFTQFTKVATSMVTSSGTVTQSDLIKVLDNWSAASKMTRAWYILNTGEYLGKDGRVMASGVSPKSAFFYALGAPLQEISSIYSAQDYLNSEKQYISDVAKRVSELQRNLSKAYQNDDMAAVNDYAAEISAVYKGLKPMQFKKVLAYTKNSSSEALEMMVIKLQKNGEVNRARQLNMFTQGATE